MKWTLTKQQVEIAEWAVGAAPEDSPDFLLDFDLRYEDAPKLDGLILTIGSEGWIEDFTYRVTEQWASMNLDGGFDDALGSTDDYNHASNIVNGRIRAGLNLAKKINA